MEKQKLHVLAPFITLENKIRKKEKEVSELT